MISDAVRRGIDELSDFIVHAASVTETLVGFGWWPSSAAPDSYPALRAAFATSAETGQSLPVSDEHTSQVIYRDAAINLAFRYWHDVSHVLRGLDFTPPQELRLASFQLVALELAGRGPETVAWRLLQADLVGQVYLSAVGRRFPTDQRRFVLTAYEDGLERAILDEIGPDVSSRIRLPALQAA